ncbi:MAG: carboxypeptidase-like regulatory domain-containing protein [Candidatus Latescibacteria bacterium]|nr:carboxypeptidase-like regulatory domain-containing protein [Candidatus Latescibacterota bacterium]
MILIKTSALITIILVLSMMCASSVYAEKIIHGAVTDAETGEALPVAHIQISGTRSGTITNDNGNYSLEIETVPAEIQISYIGYTSKRITITDDSPEEQNIALTPSPVLLDEVVVSSEDPAVRIMKEVIRRKQIWRKSLETYKADAYTRIILANDTTIVSIAESISEIIWEKLKGPREIIKAKRQTDNMTQDQNFASARMVPNFYDDDIKVVGYKVIGPTHPDALKYYEFRLTRKRKIDESIIYDIFVTPKSRFQPSFVGNILVLDEEYAMIEVHLKPGDSILFPMPINDLKVTFTQQFSSFGGDYWLPVDVRNEGKINIKLPGITFPTIIYRQLTRLTDYQVNTVQTDSLLAKESSKGTITIAASDEKVSVTARDGENTARDESSKTRSDSIFTAKEADIVPFTDDEEKAYSSIDSTMTMEKAFKPSGFLVRILDDEDKEENTDSKSARNKGVSNIFSIVTPQLGFNRVDAFHFGLKHKKTLKKRFTYEAVGAYNTGSELWSYGGEIRYDRGKGTPWSVGLGGELGTDTRYSSHTYPEYLISFRTIIGSTDYYDYYRNKKWYADFGYRFHRFRTDISTGINIEHHTSLEKTTDYNILYSNKNQRPNPTIDDGRLRSLELTLKYGGEHVPAGLLGQKRAEIKIEHSSPDFLSSDFSFTQYRMIIDWKFDTFLRRRLLPNSLDMRFLWGTFTGDLPVQRFGIIDGAGTSFGPFGVLRSLSGHPLEGERYCALFLEHNFRTVPFELFGLQWFAKKGWGIILHGAAGRTWISEKRLSELSARYRPYYYDGIHSEIGLSLNSLFGFFRLDITKRLDKSGVFYGAGLARMF